MNIAFDFMTNGLGQHMASVSLMSKLYYVTPIGSLKTSPAFFASKDLLIQAVDNVVKNPTAQDLIKEHLKNTIASKETHVIKVPIYENSSPVSSLDSYRDLRI